MNYVTSVGKESIEDKGKQVKKEVKRPEMEIYRPGMGLRGKHGTKNGENRTSSPVDGGFPSGSRCICTPSPTSCVDDKGQSGQLERKVTDLSLHDSVSSKKHVPEDVDSKKGRPRRPDQQVYVPRAKVTALQEGGEKVKDKEVVTNIENKTQKKESFLKGSDIKTSDMEKVRPSKSSTYRHSLKQGHRRGRTISGSGLKESSSNYLLPCKSLQKHTKDDNSLENCENESIVEERHVNINLSKPPTGIQKVANGDMRSSGLKHPKDPPDKNILYHSGVENRGESYSDEKKSQRSLRNHHRRYSGSSQKLVKSPERAQLKNRKSPERLKQISSGGRASALSVHEIELEDWDAELIPLEKIIAPTRAYSQEDVRHTGDFDKARDFHHFRIEQQISNPVETLNSKSCYDGENVKETLNNSLDDKFCYSENWSEAVEEYKRIHDKDHLKNSQTAGTMNQEGNPMKEIVSRNELNTHYHHTPGDDSNRQSRKHHRTREITSSHIKEDKRLHHDSDFQTNLPPRFQKMREASKHRTHHTDNHEARGGGIIKLPNSAPSPPAMPSPYPCTLENPSDGESAPVVQKHLFNPNNPNKPVIVIKPQPQAIPFVSGMENLMDSVPQTVPFSNVPFPTPFCQVSSSAHLSLVPHPPGPYGFTAMNTYPQASSPAGFPPMVEQSFMQDSHRRLKPLVEKNLQDASLLERELASYMSRGLENVDFKLLGQCRWKLQLRYENIILADPRYCAETNIEQLLWKHAFHQVIEGLRKQMEEQQETREETKKTLISLVDEGTVFYENLLEKQQETFGFNLNQLMESEDVKNGHGLHASNNVILISVQKLLIYLGDLARYRDQATGANNYGKARSWYLKAQQIFPKNGRPYNQLAILALYTRRKLDAVYFYMRSLAASNPFLSARESLLSLFDEARKKFEHMDKKQEEERLSRRQLKERRKNEEDPIEERCEIWIRSDGSSSQRSNKTEEEEEMDEVHKMSTVDLNKRFVLTFLHVHGKLFTKVGMETFSETTNLMLTEFRALLHRTPAPVSSTRLIQLLAINMFAVQTTSLKDHSLGPQCRSLLQEQALQVMLAMATLLMERGVMGLREHMESSEYPDQIVSEDISPLLPAIKVWTDWMSCHKHLWMPPPAATDFRMGCKGDVWTKLADLMTVFEQMDLDVNVVKDNDRFEGHQYEKISVPEDGLLCGFVPLLEAPRDTWYAEHPFDKDRAMHCTRINCIKYFGEYLCGISTPYLEFDVGCRHFSSLVTPSSEENTETGNDQTCDSSDDDVVIEGGFDEWIASSEGGNSIPNSQQETEIQQLWSRKEELKKKKARQDRHHAQVQAVLQETRQKRPTVVEIRPRYLIPDTNCFINHLEDIRKVAKASQFILVVPLVVINELDGLSRGLKESPDQTEDNTRLVGKMAYEAIMFLESSFAARDQHLRAVTSKGSVLDTISFRSEDTSNNKCTNDDLILSCCLHYCQDRAENYMPRDSDAPLRLYREIVLLTEDRNLRVKALTHNVPVQDLPAFLSWANIR